MSGAIGKPPSYLVRGEILTCGSYAATPHLLPQKEGNHPQQRMVEDIRPRHSNARPYKKGLPSVSLTSDSSLCRGSQGRPLSQYQYEKTTATAVVFSSPRRMSAAALSAAVDSRQPIEDRTHSQAEPTTKKPTPPPPPPTRGGARGRGYPPKRPPPRIPPLPVSLFGRGPGGGASLKRSPSPGVPLFLQYRRA